jgi:hypothetical protein
MLLGRLRGLSTSKNHFKPQHLSFRSKTTIVEFRHKQPIIRKMSKINIGELLDVCIDAAQTAGDEIRKVWKSGDLGA